MKSYHNDQLTNQTVYRNSVHLTIGHAIGIPMPYIQRPIVGLISHDKHNYNFGSSIASNLPIQEAYHLFYAQ